jgi:simple sugar transport system permease protein
LSEIPIIGEILFHHQAIVYFSYVLIFVVWFWLFHTRQGLAHRAVGERPEAAFARGTL